MVSVPERGLQLLLAVTVHVTAAGPEPFAGEQVNQFGEPLEADQLQVAPAVTFTVPLPAPAPGFALEAEMAYVQGMLAPDCDTRNNCPAMFKAPLRALVLVLASTV